MENTHKNLDSDPCAFRVRHDVELLDGWHGVIKIDPRTLEVRVENRASGSLARFRSAFRQLRQQFGDQACRRLAIALTRGMMMSEYEFRHGYRAVQELLKAAEKALETGDRDDYDLVRLRRWNDILEAGQSRWLYEGEIAYGAPTLLVAANVLHEDADIALETAYSMARWLDDTVDGQYWELLDAPRDPDGIVTSFLYDWGRDN